MSDSEVHRHAAVFILNVWDFTAHRQNPKPPSHTSLPRMHPQGEQEYDSGELTEPVSNSRLSELEVLS